MLILDEGVPKGWAAVTDPQLQTLMTLARRGVNNDLMPFVGRDVIDGCYQHPIPLERIASSKLPALAIWRHSERGRADLPWEDRQTTVIVRFDYYMQPIGLDKMDAMWPLPQLVWRALWPTMRDRSHPAVPEVSLDDAGIYEVTHGQESVQYAFAPGKSQVFPAFQATIPFSFDSTLRPPASGLDKFLRLDTDIVLPDGIPGDVHATETVKPPQTP